MKDDNDDDGFFNTDQRLLILHDLQRRVRHVIIMLPDLLTILDVYRIQLWNSDHVQLWIPTTYNSRYFLDVYEIQIWPQIIQLCKTRHISLDFKIVESSPYNSGFRHTTLENSSYFSVFF